MIKTDRQIGLGLEGMVSHHCSYMGRAMYQYPSHVHAWGRAPCLDALSLRINHGQMASHSPTF